MLSFKFCLSILLTVILCSCKKSEPINITPDPPKSIEIRGMDISFLPEMEALNTKFYDSAGVSKDFLSIIQENGVNTARIRLWNVEGQSSSGLEEVKALVAKCRTHDLKILLDFHYSDTWADPGKQATPAAWADKNITELQDAIYQYTKDVMAIIRPEYVQIGNEINGGMLWEIGRLQNEDAFISLLKAGIKGSREGSPDSKIMIHYAGMEGSEWFFDLMKKNDLDFDIIGLSYYPIWHGKSLALLESTITLLKNKYSKNVLIAEFSYPFTLQYNDFTHNFIGLDSQLVNGYAATKVGQKNFCTEIRKIAERTEALGFCYWGGEWVAFKGPTATDGSSYENQALFDFQNKALPAFSAFQ